MDPRGCTSAGDWCSWSVWGGGPAGLEGRTGRGRQQPHLLTDKHEQVGSKQGGPKAAAGSGTLHAGRTWAWDTAALGGGGHPLSVLPTMPPAPGHGSREDGGLADLSCLTCPG